MWCVWTVTSAYGGGRGRWIPGCPDNQPTNREGAIEEVRYLPTREGAIGSVSLSMDAGNFFVKADNMAWGYVLIEPDGRPHIVGNIALWTLDEQTALHQRAAGVELASWSASPFVNAAPTVEEIGRSRIVRALLKRLNGLFGGVTLGIDYGRIEELCFLIRMAINDGWDDA